MIFAVERILFDKLFMMDVPEPYVHVPSYITASPENFLIRSVTLSVKPDLEINCMEISVTVENTTY